MGVSVTLRTLLLVVGLIDVLHVYMTARETFNNLRHHGGQLRLAHVLRSILTTGGEHRFQLSIGQEQQLPDTLAARAGQLARLRHGTLATMDFRANLGLRHSISKQLKNLS